MTMQTLQCRRAEIADASEIAELLRSSIIELCVADHGHRAEPLGAWLANKTPENVETWIRNPRNILLVAAIGTAIAGAGCLRTDGHIILNYVSPSFRFQGVSKALMAALERHARELGLRTLQLESTGTALRFYRSAGFSDLGRPVINRGMTCYPMAKELDAS